ncbi:hypothetical protein Cni_G26689 [Canna indica]|uniref:Uncharacterized protein n=1 Tax=Canna indica TaxID=4628 RepID=A0AAQ3QQR4_9LILI|nr:hypothetical protein Cni_G26689 [Canna indica]
MCPLFLLHLLFLQQSKRKREKERLSSTALLPEAFQGARDDITQQMEVVWDQIKAPMIIPLLQTLRDRMPRHVRRHALRLEGLHGHLHRLRQAPPPAAGDAIHLGEDVELFFALPVRVLLGFSLLPQPGDLARVLLLGFSVLPQPGDLAYELIVFLAFLIMLFCTVIGIIILVYFPVADSMALKELEERQMEDIPYDDYYYDSASLMVNQSRHDTRRSSDVSTKPGSISFRTMIKDDAPASDGFDEISLFQGAFHIGSSSGFSPTPARPMPPLREIPRY